jgi:ATP synthase protein I
MSLLGRDGRKQLKLATRMSAVGLEVAVALFVGYFGGRWLDGHFDTAPYLTYTGLLVGLIAGHKSLWTLARRTDLDRL